MDTSRLMHLFVQHLPEFFKKKLSHNKDHHFSQNFNSQLSLFASMTNIPHHTSEDEHLIYDADGCLLLMQTTQSNLSLFNVSCDSLQSNEIEDFHHISQRSLNTNKHYNSSIDIHVEMKKMNHRSTMIFSEEIISSQTNTLQRWKGLELLNTYA